MKRALLALVALATLAGCEGEGVPLAVPCGPLDEFPRVSLVLERRCGTLDCHGSLARPLKIYSGNGLRLGTLDEITDPGVAQGNETVPGGRATTEEEFEANWRSICGLEPEKTIRVIAGEIPPEDLMVLRKPLLLEDHKGAQLFLEGDPGATCLSCWFRGFPDVVECLDAEEGCALAIQQQL